MPDSSALARVAERQWFYEFELPDGSRTPSYLPDGIAQIHRTRLDMMWNALQPVFGERWASVDAIDLACHQGYFAHHLASKGCRRVLGVDARSQHVEDTRLIAEAYGYDNLQSELHDLYELRPETLGQFDLVLMFGLLYHVENPVGILRLARALTRTVCLIETQVVPNMTGVVDWGSYRFQRHMVGSLAIIDETLETHAPEASTTGICLCPSLDALQWLMLKVGFSRVELLPVPEGGFEQLASGKRVMVAGYCD